MASSQDFFQAASIHVLLPRFPQSCKSLWPKAKIFSKLQLFMASSKNYFQAAILHGLKKNFFQAESL
jgi:hypothetical protein